MSKRFSLKHFREQGAIGGRTAAQSMTPDQRKARAAKAGRDSAAKKKHAKVKA